MATTLAELMDTRPYRAAEAAARAGEYQLLLGAGASVGAVNSGGALPLATELVAILAKRFPKAPISARDSLSRAYQRALMLGDEATLYGALREIFTDTKHQEWFAALIGFPWRRIWTLNVDDTVQTSFVMTARSKVTKLRTISWNEPYSETGDLEVVHLHGHVLNRQPQPLVFSFAEYQRAAQEKSVWSQVLGSTLGTQPVVCIGARLLDDPDVESLLMANKPTSRAPSIVVDPYIDDGNSWELEKLGYLVIRQGGQDFVDLWADAFGFDEEGLIQLWETSTVSLPQMDELRTNNVPVPPKTHDYYLGDEPLWSDAVSNRPALLDWMREAVERIETWLDDTSPKSRLEIVYSHRFAGLTSGMYLLAREARKRHMTVVQFNKSSRFNVARFVDFCRNRGPVLLLIDGGADFGDDVDRLLRQCMDRDDIEVFTLVSAFVRDDLRLEGRLTGSYPKRAHSVPMSLGRNDARSLAAKLNEQGRLGALEPLSVPQREAKLRGRDVFSALMDVEGGSGFRRRVEYELASLTAEWQRDLVLLLSLASDGRREVGIQEAAFVTGVAANDLVSSIEAEPSLSALVECVSPLLRSRQRATTLTQIIKDRGEAAALAALSTMIRALAPLATRQGLRERNRAPVLVAHLMNARLLSEQFVSEDIEAFYDGLRSIFGDWNGRYWEQRAIFAKSQFRWEQAESFAARAVSLYDDAFTRTTYSTILINRANQSLYSSREISLDFYTRGREQFEIAVDRERGSRVTRFAFLEATISLLENTMRSTLSQEDIAEISGDWRQEYTVLRIGLDDNDGFQSIQRAERLSVRYQAFESSRP